MEILKAATDWAKAEVFSSTFFIFFGILFLLATLGFWQLGKTEFAKAFIFPALIAGILLLIIGLGLVYSNKSRIANFPTAYESDASAFVQSEISRTEKTMAEYQTIVFKVIPLIIVVAALLFVFIDKPIWRAISITTIAMMVVIILVDSNANARIEAYNKQLELVEKDLKN
ncbi:MAG: heparan-alpha-glucosaminide N-acetyltransferase domain-containing protein [Chitinophagales bacterium]|nr:heparan-alpha-glucosaminide N-acetyltransferase domain-containing protein [Chitinophagales bacterium]